MAMKKQMQVRARKTGVQLACLERPMGHECTSKGHRGHTLLVTTIFICKGPMGHPVMLQMFGISCIDLVCIFSHDHVVFNMAPSDIGSCRFGYL